MATLIFYAVKYTKGKEIPASCSSEKGKLKFKGKGLLSEKDNFFETERKPVAFW